MKKILFLILFLITVSAVSQTLDTANISLFYNQFGKVSQCKNKNAVNGQAAGTMCNGTGVQWYG